MNLFKNRPLTMFCFIFISICALIYSWALSGKIILLVILAVSFLAVMLMVMRSKEKRLNLIFSALCIFSALLAPTTQIFGFELEKRSAQSYIGDNRLVFLVEEIEYSSDHSSEYFVKITEIEGKKVSFSAVAVTGFACDLEVGDTVLSDATVYSSDRSFLGYTAYEREDVYVNFAIYEESEYMVISKGRVTARAFFNAVRDTVGSHIDELLGEKSSALCRALLLGDKSNLENRQILDFKRSGVSHLLAVSGLHVSVILGAIGYLMQRLSIIKRDRCILLSLIALFFLALTGFSMSASRSVIMTLTVYFCYLMVKESDSITALFFSAALIMVIWPHAVRDVGLALSFFATLGILSAYVMVTSAIPQIRKVGLRGRILRALKRIFFAVLLTFVCNAFICAILWIVFGEISLIGLVANTMLAPLAEIFILFSPICCFLAYIPFVGDVLLRVLEIFAETIFNISGSFSDIPGAVISLRYPFAGVIISVMSIAIAVVLVIDLKRKWTVILPAICAVVAFSVCISLHLAVHRNETDVIYDSVSRNELLMFCDGYSASACDISSGAYSFVGGVNSLMSDNMATELDSFIATHYHKRHIATYEKLFGENILRRLYLPDPDGEDEREIMLSIISIAEKYGIETVVYSSGEKLEILDGWASVIYDDESEGHKSVSVVFSFGDELASYVGDGVSLKSLPVAMVEESRYIIFGKHGGDDEAYYGYDLSGANAEVLFFTDKGLARESDFNTDKTRAYAFDFNESARFKITLK